MPELFLLKSLAFCLNEYAIRICRPYPHPTGIRVGIRGRQIVEVNGSKLLKEDKSENPRNVPQCFLVSMISVNHFTIL